MSPRVFFLYDDRTAADWHPYALTRPAGELLFGALTLRARSEHMLGVHCGGHLVHDRLPAFEEPDAPGTVPIDRVPTDGDRVFLNSRVVLSSPVTSPLIPPSAPACALTVAGLYAGVALASEQRLDPALLELDAAPADMPTIELGGRFIGRVWQLMSENADQVAHDVEALAVRGDAVPAIDPAHGVHVLGAPGAVRKHPTATVEPGVVLDTTTGPIWLDADVQVRALSRLAGPAYVGPGTAILGGNISAVSIGPACKVRGEVESTVVLGYTNKAHDGFIGHAYLGRWVNLGALTTNSDLKNNYGTVRVWTPAGPVDTGARKIGCFLGDHVKTGIGVTLDTGTVIGAGSSVFGAAQPPKYVPPFSWGVGSDLTSYDIERFLTTAERVLARRGQRLTDGLRALYREAWTRSERERTGA